MDFSQALREMKSGKFCARKGWGNAIIRCGVQFPDDDSANTLPYLYMIKVKDEEVVRFPLDISCESLFAEDWEVVENANAA